MMKTIIVVSQVSFQLGHVTFEASRRTSRKNCSGLPRRRAGAGKSLPASVRRLFRRVSHSFLSFLRQLAGVEGLEPTALRFWRPMLYQLSYTPMQVSGIRWPLDRNSRTTFRRHRIRWSYFMIFATTPAPTVRPPSRMAKRSFSSIAIGTISSTSIETLSPGITISVPSGSFTIPVTSVVRK